MDEGAELGRCDWVELKDGRMAAMYERDTSHDMYVVITGLNGMPPDVFEFTDEESAQAFMARTELEAA
ncbi:hypothetical protein [Umezawaea sp. Da 62-37]|uniref:hypothetical protein n=1 Tax=Umezawaea sp. Da 62-37 TaxID=3075927 RepID=UPI0028F74309|nr:hypothetical protein [Umezawaea sp. Da 62-37]WNV90293.1 hypothetical protein RM788_19030 [Umezawaea sp. Da 62-37]